MKSESRRPRPLCWVALTMAVLGMAFPLYADTEILIGPGKNPKTEILNLSQKGNRAAVAFVPQKGYPLKECKKKSHDNSFLLWKAGKSLGQYSVHDKMDEITQHGRTKQDVWDETWASAPHPQDRDKEVHGEGVYQ